MHRPRLHVWICIGALCVLAVACEAATITEQEESIKTYPFGVPDPVAILTRSALGGRHARIYPYSFIDRFSSIATDQGWTAVHLENPYVKLSVLPQVGGKVWGAIEKSTGREFVYKNEVLKFREIALRGPWTSGGIEFNFGIVGHAPTCATPVDYLLQEAPDGTVTCVVGTMDLASRTRWNVAISLGPDQAHFETRAFWYNPTAINQSYYVWMNSAVEAAEDLQSLLPGQQHIGHNFSVPLRPWPIDTGGRDLSWYRNNRFGSHKSYFTVGQHKGAYGGYRHDADFGFGHWARYDDMPGQKLWLWALSRQGGIWEDLLTDTDGQYVEPQAGRLFNQNDHQFFAPHSGDAWKEIWFPYKEIGPMVAATPYGVLGLQQTDGSVFLGVCALQRLNEALVVSIGDREVLRQRLNLEPMQSFTQRLDAPPHGQVIEVDIADKLHYSSDPGEYNLQRPLVFHEIDEDSTEGLFQTAQRADRSRDYDTALRKYQACLKQDARHMRVLCALAELFFRRGQYDQALAYATQALEQQMYDAQANYVYGIICRRLGRLLDAKETMGWAARSMEFRSNAFGQMAEIYLQEGNLPLAREYAQRALDYNRYNVNAYQVLAVTYRRLQERDQASQVLKQLYAIDPLNHFIRFETYLLEATPENLNQFHVLIRSELPRETYLELALTYLRLGADKPAIQLLEHIDDYPVACYGLAYLHRDSEPERSKGYLDRARELSAEQVFPFRTETLSVLEWAVAQQPRAWQAKYYLGLTYWSKGRYAEARAQLAELAHCDFWPAYVCRAHLNQPENAKQALSDFEQAWRIGQSEWRPWHHLISAHNGQGQYDQSLDLARRAAGRFPKETTLRLDLIRTLVKKTQWAEALDLLNETSVLPFEGAREIHDLFVRCQMQLGLQAMLDEEYASALRYLEGSKAYPERLGTGKPYDPDFRLQDYLAYLCHDQMNQPQQAEEKRKAVHGYTLKHGDSQRRNQYISAIVLQHYGDHDRAARLLKREKSPPADIAAVIRIMQQRRDRVPYGVGDWDAQRLGNHRVVLNVTDQAAAVAVHIPWRRRDHEPEKKGVILVDAATDQAVDNIHALQINREYGDFLFAPVTVPGRYYLYTMPYTMTGRNYPEISYKTPAQSADPTWLKSIGLQNGQLSAEIQQALPQAQVQTIQSIDAFNSFHPMEVIASADETAQLLAQTPDSPYLLFPEDRANPIRMTEDLPLRWIERGLVHRGEGRALRKEFYALQIGVYAARGPVNNLKLRFSDFIGPDGAHIPASAWRCFNTGGTDWMGRRLTKICSVPQGKIQALWCGVAVPRTALPGRYQGVITVRPEGMKPTDIAYTLYVDQEILADAGDSEPWRHSRLRWLDSCIAIDDEVVAPFTPLEVDGSMLSCLGRTVTLGENGFPKRIQSRFAPEMTHLSDHPREVLADPIHLLVTGVEDEILPWKHGETKILKLTAGTVVWQSTSTTGPLSLNCTGRMECDGFVGYTVEISTARTMAVKDIHLEIPFAKDTAQYMMGLGLKGGKRPAQFDWTWDRSKNHDAVWIGAVNAGLQCSLRAENYVRPLNTNFYLLKPLNLPGSWYNEGKGGCSFAEDSPDVFCMRAYSGARVIKPGQSLFYNFNLLLTPFKPIDTAGQWSTRFYHSYRPIPEIAATGANTINNHHANDANPYINYPFIHTHQMKDYVDAAHARDMKVKIYYTVRELSNRAAELFALRSLGDEILAPGPGGGHAWLREHLGDDYIAGWFVPRYQDAAVINSGVSRWHNYYLEGLNWLASHIGIDGLYIDDVAFDRSIMKRVRKILDRNRPGALIDLHSANQYNPRDGFVNSANLYLEHFPFLNRLWFGEYFDYDSAPDYWLIEVSGIPFGLMGEMLQDGGNPWRGMVYGMSARMPRETLVARLWQVWDDFGMADSNMIGYWTPSCPIKTNHDKVLATAYVKANKTLIALASWAEEPVQCRLDINWDALDLDVKRARLIAPPIEDFQPSAEFSVSDALAVEPGRGWLLILRQ
jgi:tetratricopeptide (TPR) repeat protein